MRAIRLGPPSSHVLLYYDGHASSIWDLKPTGKFQTLPYPSRNYEVLYAKYHSSPRLKDEKRIWHRKYTERSLRWRCKDYMHWSSFPL